MFIAPNARFIVATVSREDAGAASGVLGTMQRIGSAVGIAVIGSVLFGTLEVKPGPNGVANAFGHSTRLALAVSVGLCLSAFLLAFFVPEAAERGDDAPEADFIPDVG